MKYVSILKIENLGFYVDLDELDFEIVITLHLR